MHAATQSTDRSPSQFTVTGRLAYHAPHDGAAEVRIFPPGSGRPTIRPAQQHHAMLIQDARPLAGMLRLDADGFELHRRATAFTAFYEAAAVRARYYPEVEVVVRETLGAQAVIAFDHNVRSAARAARGEPGVRVPVDAVHNDYTEQSGLKRKLEVLAEAGRGAWADRRVAFVNLWRPIVGPVQDTPLALCSAASVAMAELVPTSIHHFGEDDLSTPRHTGEIYSVLHNPAHLWFYVPDMQPDELLLLKCYDSRSDGRARFMPHTGFANPACPPEFVPRESIEVRTLVVFDEPA